MKLTVKTDQDGNILVDQPVIIEGSVSSGRADYSSIERWDNLINGKRKNFICNDVRDFKFVRVEIKSIRQAVGYDNLTLEEKIICNKYFVSGVEYNNNEVSAEKQNEYFYYYKENMNNCRQSRDLAVSAYLFKLVFTGQISKTNIDMAIKDSQPYREIYLRDGIEGIGYGDTQKGIINYVQDDLIGYAGFNQTMVDAIYDIYANGNY
jgi:hypothetical protein